MKLPINSMESVNQSTYFIADISANHDGDLLRAKKLIGLAAESGANAAKFQNFRAETIISRKGFHELGKKIAHQESWSKEVFEIYKDAELPIEWTEILIQTCSEFGIDYFTSPYDLNFIEFFSDKMPFFKIGSGDITWFDSIALMASYGKPLLLATGASTMEEIKAAVEVIDNHGVPLILMQCNTNYTGSKDNFDFLNILALEEFKTNFPQAVLGLSDHSPGHISVLGAVALGARVIEKHFTDDVTRIGPDHGFSLDPVTWKEMVDCTRLLERALGNGIKKIELNEVDSRIVQRRALRYKTGMKYGSKVTNKDLIALRPCPKNGLSPFEIPKISGKLLRVPVIADQLVQLSDFE